MREREGMSAFTGDSLICQTQLFEWPPMILFHGYSEINISISLLKESLS